jgi:hypothetical protein
MQRPVLVVRLQAAPPRSFCATVQAMRFQEAVGPARVTSRVRCPRVRAAVKGSGPEAERTLVAPASPAIALITACLAKVAIGLTWADRARPAIVRVTSVDLEHRAIGPAISVVPEHRATVRAISVGQVDRT